MDNNNGTSIRKKRKDYEDLACQVKNKMLKQEYGIDTEKEERRVPNKTGISPEKKTK